MNSTTEQKNEVRVQMPVSLLKLDKRGRMRFGVAYQGEHFRVEIRQGKVRYYQRHPALGIFNRNGYEATCEPFFPGELQDLLQEGEFLSYLGRACEREAGLRMMVDPPF